MTCKRCETSPLSGYIESRVCAFKSGVFSADNWNCATLNELRDPDLGPECYSDDQVSQLVPWEGCFVAMGWYKQRGRTEFAGILNERVLTPLTLGQAERVLERRPLFDDDGTLYEN